jgi:O-antigen ligase
MTGPTVSPSLFPSLSVRWRRGTAGARGDAVTVLSAYAALQIVLPMRYVIGPLGGAGAPARLFGLAIALWWAMAFLSQPWSRFTVRQLLRPLLALYLGGLWASYLVATLRPASSIEQLPADRGLLNALAWAGLTLVAMDGISSRARLDTLLRRLTVLGGLEALVGLAQFLTGRTLIEYLHLPGLVDTGVATEALLNRGNFTRPTGTATHPIEFGVTLSMLLPLALHYAMADRHRSLLSRWFPVVVIGSLLPLSISRSAIICTAVALAPLLAVWPPKLRRLAALGAIGLLTLLVCTLPGLLSTFIELFAGVGQDSSTQSRTGSYELAWEFIQRTPVFGRGIGTFLPRYRILDNQYLGSAIELGLLGVGALITLFVVGVVTSWRVRTAAGRTTGMDAHLGPALAAGLASAAVSFAFFDAYAFPIVPALVFLLLGCAAALRRLEIPQQGAAQAVTLWRIAQAVRRHPFLTGAGVAATLAGGFAAASASGLYLQQTQVIFVAPRVPGSTNGLQSGDGSLVAVAGLIGREFDLNGAGPLALSPDATIIDMGSDEGVWVRLPNRGGQWATNFDRAELDVQVVGPSAEAVRVRMQDTLERLQHLLREGQLSTGAPENLLITMGTSPAVPPVLHRRISAGRAVIAAVPLGLGMTLAIVLAVDRRGGRQRRKARHFRRSGPAGAVTLPDDAVPASIS